MAWDRDLGDEPAPTWRDEPPDIRTPIDPDAPVSGHHPPDAERPGRAESSSPTGAAAPEHDWLAAEAVLFPILRPLGTHGTRLADVDPAQLASEGLKTHAQPVVDDGPCDLSVAYVLRAGGFEVLVNADHLLAWGASPEDLRRAATANLRAWSERTAWTSETSGARHLVSSASVEGGDAARILLPEVREHLARELGAAGQVLIGIPERDLLIAGSLASDDGEFAVLFAEYVRGHADGADLPLDRRVLELVGTDLRTFGAPDVGPG